MQRELDEADYCQLEKHLNAYAVLGVEGTVITIGHRIRRVRYHSGGGRHDHAWTGHTDGRTTAALRGAGRDRGDDGGAELPGVLLLATAKNGGITDGGAGLTKIFTLTVNSKNIGRYTYIFFLQGRCL